MIAIEGLEDVDRLKSFTGFEPPSNNQLQSILSKKLLVISHEGLECLKGEESLKGLKG